MAFGTRPPHAEAHQVDGTVDPSDRNALLQVIQINSFLRGGLHNPIVPVYRETPATWSDLPLEPPAHCAEVPNMVIFWKGLSPFMAQHYLTTHTHLAPGNWDQI